MDIRFLVALLLCTCRIAAQQSTANTFALDSRTFRKVLNEQFTTLITGQAKNSIGTYASFETEKPQASFGASAIFKNGTVLSIKTTGGITDGVYALFNNSSLNKKVALNIKLDMFSFRRKSLTFHSSSYDEYISKLARLENKFLADSIAITHRRDINALTSTSQKVEDQLKTLYGLSSEPGKKPSDSLAFAIAVLELRRDSVNKALQSSFTPSRALVLARNFRNERRDSAISILKVYGFAQAWISVGYNVRNDAFKLMNAKLPPNEQISKKSFVSHELNLQYNKYNWTSTPLESYFFNAGVGFSYGHNLDDLSKLEITEVTNYGAGVNERTSTDKFSVYSGAYRKDLIGLRFYADYYRFLFSDNRAALHPFVEYVIKTDSKPLTSPGLAFLVSFKKVKEENTIINAEVYYKCTDLFKNIESDKSLFERNEVGLRFAFPFVFKTK